MNLLQTNFAKTLVQRNFARRVPTLRPHGYQKQKWRTLVKDRSSELTKVQRELQLMNNNICELISSFQSNLPGATPELITRAEKRALLLSEFEDLAFRLSKDPLTRVYVEAIVTNVLSETGRQGGESILPTTDAKGLLEDNEVPHIPVEPQLSLVKDEIEFIDRSLHDLQGTSSEYTSRVNCLIHVPPSDTDENVYLIGIRFMLGRRRQIPMFDIIFRKEGIDQESAMLIAATLAIYFVSKAWKNTSAIYLRGVNLSGGSDGMVYRQLFLDTIKNHPNCKVCSGRPDPNLRKKMKTANQTFPIIEDISQPWQVQSSERKKTELQNKVDQSSGAVDIPYKGLPVTNSFPGPLFLDPSIPELGFAKSFLNGKVQQKKFEQVREGLTSQRDRILTVHIETTTHGNGKCTSIGAVFSVEGVQLCCLNYFLSKSTPERTVFLSGCVLSASIACVLEMKSVKIECRQLLVDNLLLNLDEERDNLLKQNFDFIVGKLDHISLSLLQNSNPVALECAKKAMPSLEVHTQT